MSSKIRKIIFKLIKFFKIRKVIINIMLRDNFTIKEDFVDHEYHPREGAVC